MAGRCRCGLFLDAGCGQGSEIKELTARFSHSPVRDIDLNESAIAVVRAGTRGNPLVSAEVGDITDLAWFESHPR